MRHKRQPPVERVCGTCGKRMIVPACKIRQGHGKFCSTQCAAISWTKPENDTMDKVRAHKERVQRVTKFRPCNICGEPIKAVPGDVDARYARFCYTCRTNMELDEEYGADRWIGAGDECGATVGA